MEDFGAEDALMDWAAPFPAPLPLLPEAGPSTERAVTPGEREWSCGLTTCEHNEISVRSRTDHGCTHAATKKGKSRAKKGCMTAVAELQALADQNLQKQYTVNSDSETDSEVELVPMEMEDDFTNLGNSEDIYDLVDYGNRYDEYVILSSNHSITKKNSPVRASKAAARCGIGLVPIMSQASLCSCNSIICTCGLENYNWMLDSGASAHVTPHINDFIDFETCDPKPINLASGISKIG